MDIHDITGCTPLHLASKQHSRIVSVLLNKGCNVNVQNNLGNSALHIAVSANQHTIVEILIRYEADINLKDNYGRTPLLACDMMDMKTIQYLVDHKADVNVFDNMGRGALHTVASSITSSTFPTNIKNTAIFFEPVLKW